MNYNSIHDSIIRRAKSRTLDPKTYYERHHITPKCEGGDLNGELVSLTIKEHRLVHYLRYKITKNVGNLRAYYMMTNRTAESVSLQASEAARARHALAKEQNYTEYLEKQRMAGRKAGAKCFENTLGFHAMSYEQRSEIGRRAGTKLATNKIGMFSDEYRVSHAASLCKPINTPDGIFGSSKEAAEFYNIGQSLITYRANSKSAKFVNWFYITEKE